jgi:sortase (surface protein transpeptidase)
MRKPTKSSTFIASISVVLVGGAATGFVVGAPIGIAGRAKIIEAAAPAPAVPASTAPNLSALETPVPATPFPTTVPHIDHSLGCPQLSNPGGRVEWTPSDDAGPWPTDGTVSIPTIGTSAPIVRVGVDHEAQMVVPPNAGQVSWLDQGGIPGRTNNIVLAGHVTWAGVPGAFYRIGDLLPGDMIVLSIEGRRMIFRTAWVCEFPRTSKLAPRIMGYTDIPSVTLITCSGAWDAGAGTHADRIVARAELVY